MAIGSNSNRAKKTYSFYRQRPVVNENFEDANRMAKTYGSVRQPDDIITTAPPVVSTNFILTEASEELLTEAGDNLITES